MPRNTKSKTRPAKKENNISVLDIFKFGESYTSLILGIVVVVIATIILLTFVKGKNAVNKPEFAKEVKQEEIIDSPTQTKNLLTNEQKNTTITSSKSARVESKPTPTLKNKIITGSSYTVAQGDTLWNIAEKKYNSGYNWVDIQKANNITNPDVLFVGTKLTLPNVGSKTITISKANNNNQKNTNLTQTNKISGSNYTVGKGDNLWNISVRAYGDGYAWTKISQANKLSNPDIIHPGNKLIIPRK